jgi:hypothetical protein
MTKGNHVSSLVIFETGWAILSPTALVCVVSGWVPAGDGTIRTVAFSPRRWSVRLATRVVSIQWLWITISERWVANMSIIIEKLVTIMGLKWPNWLNWLNWLAHSSNLELQTFHSFFGLS